MANEQVLRLLRGIPLFADLEQEELMTVLRMARPLQCTAGDVLCKQGDPGDCMYVIQAGQVSVVVRSADGKAIPVATLKAGDLIGEMTLVDDAPRSADCVAASVVRLFRIDRAQFEVMRGELHPAAFKILRRIALTVCARLRHVNETVSRVVGAPAPQQGQAPSATGLNVRTRTGVERERQQEARSFWTGLLNRVKG